MDNLWRSLNRARDKNFRAKGLSLNVQYEKIILKIATMKALTSSIFILLFSSAYIFAQDSIGFSFNSDRDNTAMDETTVAGIVPSSGWVSTDGGFDAQGGANGSISNLSLIHI